MKTEPSVIASNGAELTYSEARHAWEAGEFSDWAEANGFPLSIDNEEFTGWQGVEDALSDDDWDR